MQKKTGTNNKALRILQLIGSVYLLICTGGMLIALRSLCVADPGICCCICFRWYQGADEDGDVVLASVFAGISTHDIRNLGYYTRAESGKAPNDPLRNR